MGKVGKVGLVVGKTLGPTLERADTLLQLRGDRFDGGSMLNVLESDKVAQALKTVASETQVVNMNYLKNECNTSDPRVPANLDCSKAGLFLIPKGEQAVHYEGLNYKASPVLQFVNDNLQRKF